MKLSPTFDWSILLCVLVLAGFGAAIIGSVAPQFLASQLFFYLLGLALFFIFSRIDYRLYAHLARPIYLLSLFLLGVTLIIGLESRGAARWVPLGPFRLQFSEILKPFLIASFAASLSQSDGNSLRRVLLRCLWLAPPVIFVLKQPDLGSAIVYLLAFAVMLFASGLNLGYLLTGTVGALLSIPLGWHFLADYQKNRILTFLKPQSDPLGASYNAIQAIVSVGSGLILGRGLGRGTQSQLYFLPERHTDFVFASLAEELGFVGSAVVLLVFFFLVSRILTIASQSTSQFGKLTAIGIATFLVSQIFINVGMNIGLVPVTGITLPLVSYGGSSVLSVMVSLGIIENIAASNREEGSAIHIV